jgi:hypothetical protein
MRLRLRVSEGMRMKYRPVASIKTAIFVLVLLLLSSPVGVDLSTCCPI